MRKVVVSEMISLNGVMEGPGPADSFAQAGWTIPYVSEQFSAFKLTEVLDADALLLGRNTYDGFSKAWPNMKDDAGFADKMNSMPKYVVSASLPNAEWNNSHVLNDNVVERINTLKSEEGGDILVNGSATLLAMLMEQQLVDEYRLLVYPVVLGVGKKLFRENAHATLQLVQAETFDKGVMLLTYKPAI